jgi:ABC-type multidrug transport system permease subunit
VLFARQCYSNFMPLQVVIEIPYVFLQASYYTLIVYAMMSFQWTAAKFFWFFFVSSFSFLYFTYYGMMTVSISPNHEVAAIFAAAFYSLFNLFSGFFIPRPVRCFSSRTIPVVLFCKIKRLMFSFCFPENS